MSFDAHKNFAYSTVATAPSPATSGTSLVVQAGEGAKFPAVPFNATVWPVSTQPTTTNAEIVRVTNIATDTLTITRAQESTSARTVVVGDQISATITKKTIEDIETAIPSIPVTSVFTRTGAVVAVDGDYSGVVATHLTGAVAATRYVGGTASVAPTTGTFAVGDFVVTQTGHIYVCTVAGSPGTWVDAGSVGNLVSSVFTRTGAVVATSGDYTAAQVTNAADKSSGSQQAFTGEVAAPDFTASGLTGATSASRYVGATASGAPVSGTFVIGDFVVARNGHIFVCTVAGSPGTWVDVGSVGNLVTSVFGRAGVVVAVSGDYNLNQIGNATADYSINSHKLTSVTDPTSAQDAATKNYVDSGAGLAKTAVVNVYGVAGGTWTKPSGASIIEIVCIGSGAQGGGGRTGTGAASISGGGGGAGGAVNRAVFQASDVSSPQTVTVGAGGTGAGTANNAGADGAGTSFGSLLFAGGGGGGAAGASAASSSGGSGASIAESVSGVTNANFSANPAVGGQGAVRPTAGAIGLNSEDGGASGAGSTSGGTGKKGGCSIRGGPGGGGGGGSTSTVGQNADQGGTTQSYSATGGGGGTGGSGGASPNAGGNGTSFLGPYCGSAGGGGGGGSTGVAGRNGGTGGIGAGGGGGGASANTTGGTGGVGGDGRCIVISYF